MNNLLEALQEVRELLEARKHGSHNQKDHNPHKGGGSSGSGLNLQPMTKKARQRLGGVMGNDPMHANWHDSKGAEWDAVASNNGLTLSRYDGAYFTELNKPVSKSKAIEIASTMDRTKLSISQLRKSGFDVVSEVEA